MNMVDSVLVGYSIDTEKDHCILTVGQKRFNGSVEIINAFQGEEAKELYGRLTTKPDHAK